ncbi:HAD-IC family P-type ATPase [Streptomyces sp. WMMC905]|uniref:cation-translocating P-type ATPase n=1 Tax=Streptomyces sp. WMMC905 TaxID=3404123 RepID=UPI003B9524E3
MAGGRGVLTLAPGALAGAVSAGPRLAAGAVAPAIGVVAGTAAGAARAGVRGADFAARAGRAARAALPGRGDAHWRAGARAHLALAPTTSTRGAASESVASSAARAARELAEHPDVAFAYWDAGLTRMVVAAAGDTVDGALVCRAERIAAAHGLVRRAEGPADQPPHPGDPTPVRVAGIALVADILGVAAGLTGSTLRLPPLPRMCTAVATSLRENPAFRAWLRSRLGAPRRDVALAVANALVHGAGQSPVSLVLDGALRAWQLVEALTRVAAFESIHDTLCDPARVGPPAAPSPRPAPRVAPAQEYAANAAAGSVAGALATLLVKHDLTEAAEAVLAGSPKAARYGPDVFRTVLSAALCRGGVLVREPERLRQLEMARVLVLHAGALRLPGRDADPWAEVVLDAARRAGLRVVMVRDPASDRTDFAGLADHVVDAGRPLRDVVEASREEGGVITVVRPLPGDDPTVVEGLLGGDLAVALADGPAAVAWAADLIAPHGLSDVWRLLRAVPAARRVGRRSQTLARSGAALSGLLVAVGEARRRRGRALVGLPTGRHTPVDVGAGAALFTGVRAALGVALARTPRPRPRVAWHTLDPEGVRDRIDRLRGPGPSASREWAGRARGAVRRAGRAPVLAPVTWTWQLGRAVRGELDDPLTPVLAVGSAAEAILGSAVDALLVVGALDLNALVGGFQRLRAERALAGLLARQKRRARLVVGETSGVPSVPRVVEAARLRPSDIVELETDDVVPADARLLWEDGLEVDESALTGESLPVGKSVEPVASAPVAERRCMVHEGTTVVAGRARAVVVDVGPDTEAARAVALAARAPAAPGVQARLRELTRKALPLTLAGGAAVTGLSLLRGARVRNAVSGGVSVAVAAVPEGLPLVATVAQLAAARRLGRRGVLVRTPRTLEALGRMDTMCFDKTGTLTENRLRLVRVGGADGVVRRPGEAGAASTVRVAARACPRLDGDGGRRPRHATDGAVLDAAGADPGWVQEGGLPFETSRGYAAAVGREDGRPPVLVVKGAPETVLPACVGMMDDAERTAQALARRGLRVLAVAQRPLTEGEEAEEVLEHPPGKLEFTGLVALSDVPRQTSPALVRGLREAGVRPVVLTGDHPQTARAVAAELGWPEDAAVITGDELAAADRAGRARMVRDADVVARVAPEQKLLVVEALRDAGRVVGMVGDGANDAAAIRAADIGVGLDTRGSAAARNAADLVVAGTDLLVLTEAIREGRALWRSVADAIAILVGGNAGEVGFGLLGTALGGAAPLSTRQMLLVNLFTDLFPAMAVAVTPPEEDEPEEGAGGGGAPAAAPLGTTVLGAPLVRQIRHRALTTCLGAVVAWLLGRLTPGTERRATTMALCAVVGTQLAQTLTDRRGSRLVRATSLGSAAALVALVQTPVVSALFGCTPLGPLAWTAVLVAIAVALAGQRAVPRVEEALARWWPRAVDRLPEPLRLVAG